MDAVSVALEIRRISKSFSSIKVLDEVSLTVEAGEVHALLGENGAGKSTLLKILSGVYQPDSGVVLIEGRELQCANAHQALRQGIATVYQELTPFPDLTVAENVLIGQEPVRCRAGWIDRRRLNEEAARVLGQLGAALAPHTRLRELRVADMQTVEIAKALAHRARVILFDEPTSALGEREVDALFRTIRELRARGVAIVYISHKLEEVFALADRVTVLRDGRVVATHRRGELRKERLVYEMIGRDMDMRTSVHVNSCRAQTLLSVEGLGLAQEFRGVSFDVRSGEILGLAGLVGAGRTAVLNALYGLSPAESGEIRVRGCLVRIRRPADALRAGIGLVTEDRRRYGFVPRFNIARNITLPVLRKCCRMALIQRSEEVRVARESMEALRIRGGDQRVQRLSGGNQQKVVFARTLAADPEILLLDEPTRGIDVGAKAEVHGIIRELARAGKAVVIASSELPELLALSHRLLVMRQGEIVAEMDPTHSRPEEILSRAMPD